LIEIFEMCQVLQSILSDGLSKFIGTGTMSKFCKRWRN